jgi:hypothetical protein
MISPAGCRGICVQAAFKNKYCFDMPVSAEHMTAMIWLYPASRRTASGKTHARADRGKTVG